MSAPLTLLFVDDEPSMLSGAKRLLSGSTFVVLTADDAASAIEILRTTPVDVLVTDLDMPGMNGLELVALARREFPTTLRMLLTATPSQERVLRALNEGEVARFFVKPFDPIGFRDTMLALASRIELGRRARAEAAQQQRSEALVAWANARFPQIERLRHTSAGETIVEQRDVQELLERFGIR